MRLSIYSILFISCIFGWLAPAYGDAPSKYWIFLDGKSESVYSDGAGSGIQKRALERRSLRKTGKSLFDVYDLPISQTYIDEIRSRGIEIITVSKWLNAVSCRLAPEQLDELARLPFVKQVQRVRRYNNPVTIETYAALSKQTETHQLDYGLSLGQNAMMYVPYAHDMGLSGKGILVGMLDTGFDYVNRPVFSHMDILAEYDFQQGDSITANETGDYPSQHNHGTRMLSTIAGFQEGELIGPAYGATYALAKTEVDGSENSIEEDYWVQGIEWLESLGVDVVNSSLGYSEFDDDAGYTYADMDGNTAVTTIAADIAVSKGIVLVNSAGNQGDDAWKYINAPADGDSVITVGAVTKSNQLAAFSSVGPTADGRIKPDVVAAGVGVYNLTPTVARESSFDFGSGTSFSSALVAGVCALMLEAHPELTPAEVRDALRNTADRATAPDTAYGWGLVNAPAAIFYHGMVVNQFRSIYLVSQDRYALDASVHWRTAIDTQSVFLYYREKGTTQFHEMQMDSIYSEWGCQFRAVLPQNCNRGRLEFYFSVTDARGDVLTSPRNAPDTLFDSLDLETYPVCLEDSFDSSDIVNYPNPFQTVTTFSFETGVQSHIELTLFNARGQLVRKLMDGSFDSGSIEVSWDATNQFGRPCASGSYLAEFKINRNRYVRKVLLVR